jgi:hypothetical protein
LRLGETYGELFGMKLMRPSMCWYCLLRLVTDEELERAVALTLKTIWYF